MAMKMNSKQKKIGIVMREFKKGELNIGGSSKKVKNPKQELLLLYLKQECLEKKWQ